ncbi:sugar ABC transporter substrate-binding protein [Occultella glacieicola]|uniref:Sugar ABC transporter substrate-binding protein n=1 Tax=Occultella glacieicola TaxID=2518684 RepID=A0ABY2E583_9MICO|nr:sugar ABC transporter substrate-binding protein [Occultella glacieicola]TDE94764.1 sugar ABC transporter substrate-binding protein [Occultella glacieicola]
MNRTHSRRRGLAPRVARTSAALAAAALVAAGCSGPAEGDGGGTAIDYWLWDANQLPAYQRCAEAFEEQNPDLQVRISQYGWDDYWSKLTAGFVAGAGPDVFTDHLTRYPEFAQRDLLVDLSTLEATADTDPGGFQAGLTDLWTGQDDGLYGMPKDFDTIALFYDRNLVEEAGLSPEDLDGLDWNPEDGGSFEEVIAHLSVDEAGVRGDEEGFDAGNVAVYGMASNGSGGTDGQTQWSWLAASTGWNYTNADVWGTEYHFDDPRVQDSLAWLFGLVDKGFMAPFEEVGTAPNPQQALGSGRAALSANGSWMLGTYANLEGIDLGIASLPSGPVGHPVSMYNGLGDSISAQSPDPEEAARWVAFLGSDDCQRLVGEAGVVFPARPAGTEAAIEAFADRGLDVSPFTDLVDNGYTVFFPVTDNYGEISALVTPIMDEIYIGSRDVGTLTEVNEQVNSILGGG